ncbi:MAG: hypothetical protein EOP08_04775 [Proteobacteria bacterium]|nr:MAG: hypothetical protein EOP08_04775 [Pseudomonadota bacterium]
MPYGTDVLTAPQLELTRVSSHDVPARDLASFVPASRADVHLLVEAHVGVRGETGSEVFTFLVATPEALRARDTHGTVLASDCVLLVSDYDWTIVHAWLRSTLAECIGLDGDGSFDALRRHLRWEREGQSGSQREEATRLVCHAIDATPHPRAFAPDTYEEIDLELRVVVGDENLPERLELSLAVCSPEALRTRLHGQDFLHGGVLVVSDYRWRAIERWVHDTVARCEAPRWRAAARNLERYFGNVSSLT